MPAEKTLAEPPSRPQRRPEAPPPAPVVEPGRRRLLSNPGISVAVLVVWLALVNDLHPRMLLLGALWAVLVPLSVRALLPVASPVRSWGTLLRFIPLFLWDVLVANIAVAWLIVNVRRRVRPGWMVIPLDVTHPYGITTLANVISLTPGTVSAELGPDRRTLLVHALDLADPAAEVARIKQRYEAPIMEIFG